MKGPRKPLTIPQRGVIKGGQCAGWRFLFRRFAVVATTTVTGYPITELQVQAMCSRPGWPFPAELSLRPEQYLRFSRVVGDRAKTLPAEPLIANAFRLAELPAPAWLDTTERLTLRAAAVRSRKGRS